MSHETSREAAPIDRSDVPTTYDLDVLEAALGPITVREFNDAPDYTKADLWEWLLAMVNLTDVELYHAARSAITEDALVQRFRNMNFEHVHCRATACYSESDRRLKQEGHADDCRPSGIYGRAHADVMLSHGYAPSSPVRPCTCGARERYRDQHGEASAGEG
jgi:hypothetical protein